VVPGKVQAWVYGKLLRAGRKIPDEVEVRFVEGSG